VGASRGTCSTCIARAAIWLNAGAATSPP
jgi:hypothetical protein